LKIIHIYHHDPLNNGKGGVVRYINNLINYQNNINVDVELLGAKFITGNVKREKFISIVTGTNFWLTYFINLFIKLPFIEVQEDSIFHIHRIEYALPFIFIKRKFPIVITLHGEHLGTLKTSRGKFVNKLINPIYCFLEKIVFMRANAIVSVSKKVHLSYFSHNGRYFDKTYVIPVGIDINEANQKINIDEAINKYNNNIKILFIGVLEKRKNVSMLIDAFYEIKRKYSDISLYIVGNGPLRECLNKKIVDKNMSDEITLFGEIDRDQVLELLSISDIFALPSFSEGSPTVIKEALQHGLFIVSTDVGDVKDLIEPINAGVIIDDPSDFLSFSNGLDISIQTIKQYDGDIKKIITDKIQNFGFDVVVDNYNIIYCKISRDD